MVRRLMLCGVLAMAAGCGGLADESRDSSLTVNSAQDAGNGLVRFNVGLHTFVPFGGCSVLSMTAQATVNGKPADIRSRGGESKERMGYCEPIWFTGVAPADSETITFRVFDLGLDRVAEFQNVFEPLSIRIVSPEDGVLHPGQTLVVERSPATDTFAAGRDSPPRPELMSFFSGARLTQFVPNFAKDGNRLSFTVPTEVLAGEGFIAIEGYYDPGVTRCDFTQCRFTRLKSSGQVPVVFTAP
ncbi:hypothetical protein [Archangium sp. Cb G35]|uniref:hypothetical protein n=1 Tax=Archangium sp. Cb G35 TaxID=1920190 RepID=UPI0011614C32|nr:hypothetical protein [Archangium sp. Cb G35]